MSICGKNACKKCEYKDRCANSDDRPQTNEEHIRSCSFNELAVDRFNAVDFIKVMEMVKNPQTNEEWLRSATFEEMAGAIYEWYTLGFTRGKNGKKLNSITEIVGWLKEAHE